MHNYEELNLQQYKDMQGRELVFNNPDNRALKEQQPSPLPRFATPPSTCTTG